LAVVAARLGLVDAEVVVLGAANRDRLLLELEGVLAVPGPDDETRHKIKLYRQISGEASALYNRLYASGAARGAEALAEAPRRDQPGEPAPGGGEAAEEDELARDPDRPDVREREERGEHGGPERRPEEDALHLQAPGRVAAHEAREEEPDR